MVDRADLSEINRLYLEQASVAAALDALGHGGRIVAMTIALQDEAVGGGRPIGVNTSGMTYPQQMVEGIKTQLQARQQAIEQELVNAGITGGQAQSPPPPAAGQSRTARLYRGR